MTHGITKTIAGVGAAAGLVALVLTGAALAQRAPGDPAGPRGRFGMGLGHGAGMIGLFRQGLRQLDLSDAQREQVRNVFTQHESDFRSAAQKVFTARTALIDAASDGTTDESAIRERSAALAAAQADLAILGARVHGEVFQILTPEQQQKAEALGGQMRERMKNRLERRGPLGGDGR